MSDNFQLSCFIIYTSNSVVIRVAGKVTDIDSLNFERNPVTAYLVDSNSSTWRSRDLRLLPKGWKLVRSDTMILKTMDFAVNENFLDLLKTIKQDCELVISSHQDSKMFCKLNTTYLYAVDKKRLLSGLYGSLDQDQIIPATPQTKFKVELESKLNFLKSVKCMLTSEVEISAVSVSAVMECPLGIAPTQLLYKKEGKTIEFYIPSLKNLTGAPIRPLKDVYVQIEVSDSVQTSIIRVCFEGLIVDFIEMSTAKQSLMFHAATGPVALGQLLQRSAEFKNALNSKDDNGSIALHYAVMANSIESIKLLVQHGSHIHMINNEGYTPIDIAALLGSNLPTISVPCVSCPAIISLDKMYLHVCTSVALPTRNTVDLKRAAENNNTNSLTTKKTRITDSNNEILDVSEPAKFQFSIVTSEEKVTSADKIQANSTFIKIRVPKEITDAFTVSAKYIVLNKNLNEIFSSKSLTLTLSTPANTNKEGCIYYQISPESVMTPQSLLQASKQKLDAVYRNLSISLKIANRSERNALIAWDDVISTAVLPVDYFEYKTGPLAGSTQIKTKHWNPSVTLGLHFVPTEQHSISVYLREENRVEHMEVFLGLFTPTKKYDAATNTVAIPKIKVEQNQLPGKVIGHKFYLEFQLKKNGVTLQIIESGRFYMGTHGKIIAPFPNVDDASIAISDDV